MDTSRNHEIEGFSGFRKVKSKSCKSKMKQNDSMELSGHYFLKTYNKNGPPDSPNLPDPQTSIFPGFPGFL